MQIRVKFLGGPLNDQVARVEVLDQVKVFFSERDRQAFVYVRENETSYMYHSVLSKGMTEKYDEAKEKFAGAATGSVKWSENEISD